MRFERSEPGGNSYLERRQKRWPEVVDLLSDEDCRTLLEAADEPRTPKELHESTGIPVSTVYHKLDELSRHRMVEESYRMRSDGRHERRYRTCIKQLKVEVDRSEEGSRLLVHVDRTSSGDGYDEEVRDSD